MDRSHPALRLPDSVDSPLGIVDKLVSEVIASLEAPPVDEPLCAVVGRCNAELESFLEAKRDREPRDDDDLIVARDDLSRLLRLLAVVERADAPMVVRQIRRVLGRLDGCGVL